MPYYFQRVKTKQIEKALNSGELPMRDPRERKRFLALAKRGPKYDSAHESHAIVAYLEELEKFFDCFFGVESLWPDFPEVFYLNVGETYENTIVWKSGALLWSNWGGEYEESERERFEQEGEARCAYCGEWGEWEEFFQEESYCEHCAESELHLKKCAECREWREASELDCLTGECLECLPESERV